jgi:hypothetical protein
VGAAALALGSVGRVSSTNPSSGLPGDPQRGRPRGGTLAGRLTRAGFEDAARAERMLADAALLAVLPEPEALLPALADTADPDQALLALA